jgi:transcription termination factor NusB
LNNIYEISIIEYTNDEYSKIEEAEAKLNKLIVQTEKKYFPQIVFDATNQKWKLVLMSLVEENILGIMVLAHIKEAFQQNVIINIDNIEDYVRDNLKKHPHGNIEQVDFVKYEQKNMKETDYIKLYLNQWQKP